MAAVLSSDMNALDKEVVPLIEEWCAADGLVIKPPDVNAGSFKFAVKAGEVIYGLGRLKGSARGRLHNWLPLGIRMDHLQICLIFAAELELVKSIGERLRP